MFNVVVAKCPNPNCYSDLKLISQDLDMQQAIFRCTKRKCAVTTITMLIQLDHSKEKPLQVKYTLEQFLEEQKRAKRVTETLEKMASVMEKFEKFSILINYRITKLEKQSKKKHGKR